MRETKERPILFSGPLVRAILEGRKTVTRRVMKPQPDIGSGKWRWNGHTWEKHMGYPIGHDIPKSPYGRPGDLLYVRETWAPATPYPNNYVYRATYKYPQDFRGCWKPSIHMPKSASRLWLRVTDVRVERLQDISHEQALAEGIDPDAPYNNYGTGSIYRDTFAELWDSINAKRGYSWDSNPFVWVVEFERVER